MSPRSAASDASVRFPGPESPPDGADVHPPRTVALMTSIAAAPGQHKVGIRVVDTFDGIVASIAERIAGPGIPLGASPGQSPDPHPSMAGAYPNAHRPMSLDLATDPLT